MEKETCENCRHCLNCLCGDYCGDDFEDCLIKRRREIKKNKELWKKKKHIKSCWKKHI